MLMMAIATTILIIVGWLYFRTKPSSQKKFDSAYLSKSQQRKGSKDSKNEGTATSQDVEKDTKAGKKVQQGVAKKPKNKVDHRFFFKSFKKNESSVLDFDISRDNQFIGIASKDRSHVIYDIRHDSVVKFSTNTIPQCIAVSEHGRFVAVALEKKVAVFRVDGEKVTQTSLFDAALDNVLGLYVSEEPEHLVVAGSQARCFWHVYDLQGNEKKLVKSDISEGDKVHFDKFRKRCVYFSQNPDIRIFSSQFTVKSEWKDFAKEHSAFGHKNGVLSGCFAWKSSMFFSLSKDKTLKQWDVSHTGFDDSHVKCVNSWDVSPDLIETKPSIEWVGSSGEGDKTVNYLCLTHGPDLLFYKCSRDGFKQVEKIEDAHHGELISKIVYVASETDESKGVLFSQSDKKLFSWKPKFE